MKGLSFSGDGNLAWIGVLGAQGRALIQPQASWATVTGPARRTIGRSGICSV